MRFPCCPPAALANARRCGARVVPAGAAASLAFAAFAAFAAGPARGAETASDVSTRALLEKLDEELMPDVALWVLDRVAADPAASAELKSEVPLRRSQALVGLSRTEADGKKRAALFDEAQQQIDQFLATKPAGSAAIDAFVQKGNLLVVRGTMRLEQAKRPGADAPALRKEAVGFFDQAIKALEGKVKPNEEIKAVDNAEDAVIKELREVNAQITALKPKPPPKNADDKDKKAPKKPVPRNAATEKQLERLENEQKALQTRLVQTRLVVANAYFEKAKIFDEKSKEWTAAIEESTKQFKEIADKYPAFGAGLLARYYEGRNLAVLGKWEKAAGTLAGLVAIEEKIPLAIMLRTKALATSLECWLADKRFAEFDDGMRKFALTNVPPAKLDADWLTLKYRAAVFLKEQSAALAGKEAARAKALLGDAGKLAMDVAKANREFGDEARALVRSLGKDVVKVEGEGFAGIVDEAKLAMETMREKQAEVKKLQAEGQDAAAAVAAAAAARDEALAKYDEALARAGNPPAKGEDPPNEQTVNNARYMRTFLLYDAKRFAEAGDQGAMLVERFPNALGSRQAGMIALAAFQQLARGADAAAAASAKEKLQGLARSIATIWPAEKEGADALGILVGTAIESRSPQKMVELVDSLPAAASGRAAVVGKAGTALWREVLDQGRAEGADRAAPEAIAGWKAKARAYLDEALQAQPGTGAALRTAAAAALARAQIALDDGDAAKAVAILDSPGQGPWKVVNDPQADAALREGAFAESALTVALRAFIQAERLDDAQQAMDRLEALAGAGDGEEKSTRLSAMYSSMARQLQEQLGRLSDNPDADARQKAVAILGGFEKFLDGFAKRDQKVASQLWVATTYQELGSGKGTGAVVPKAKAEQYLDRAADVYKKLFDQKGDADVARFEPSIRLRMASIYRERGRWDDALEQIDWILSDAKRQNSLETQVQAAEILQAAAQSLAGTDAAAAEARFREATAGRTKGAAVAWGWGGIANKIGRQAFAGNDEKSLKARDLFFTARLNQTTCLLARSQLPGKAPDQARELRTKAEQAVAMTRKMYPDLGGPTLQSRFEKLLKEIQKLQGSATPGGFAELDEKAAAAAAAAAGPSAGK